MAGLVPAIHVLETPRVKDVDARLEAGHDGGGHRRLPSLSIVMAGLVPAIHVFRQRDTKTWMHGPRPGMMARSEDVKAPLQNGKPGAAQQRLRS
jgi:hypothetical protein